MFLTASEHYAQLKEMVLDEPDKIQINSFGLYASIQPDGKAMHDKGGKYISETFNFLEMLKDVPKVQIIIGIEDFISCGGKYEPPCQACYSQYARKYMRHFQHAMKWPNIEWKIKPNSHAKFFNFFYDDGGLETVIGGRNLTDSAWDDVSYFVDDASEVKVLDKAFTEWWDEALEMNEANLSTLLEDAMEKFNAVGK